MPTSQSRRGNTARDEVLDALMEDHKRVKKAFRDFEKRDEGEDVTQLVEQTCAELTVHAMLEEEVFYPAIREALEEEGLLEEALVEHQSAKQLISQLESMSSDEERYAATFKVLGEYVKHHIKEEEGEMFQQIAKAKIDWEGLGEAMNARRAELMEQYMPESASMDAEEEEPESGRS